MTFVSYSIGPCVVTLLEVTQGEVLPVLINRLVARRRFLLLRRLPQNPHLKSLTVEFVSAADSYLNGKSVHHAMALVEALWFSCWRETLGEELSNFECCDRSLKLNPGRRARAGPPSIQSDRCTFLARNRATAPHRCCFARHDQGSLDPCVSVFGRSFF